MDDLIYNFLMGGWYLKRVSLMGLILVLLFVSVGCAAKGAPPADGVVAFEEAPGAVVQGLSDVGCSTASHEEITVYRSQKDLKARFKEAKKQTRATTRSSEDVFDELLAETLTPSFFENKAVLVVPMMLNDTATNCDLQSLRIEKGALVATLQKSKAEDHGAQVVKWTTKVYCVDASAVDGITGTQIEEKWASQTAPTTAWIGKAASM